MGTILPSCPPYLPYADPCYMWTTLQDATKPSWLAKDVPCCAKLLQSCLTLCDPLARQAPLSMGFSRQEYLSLLPCPLPGDLPNTGFEPESLTPPALAGRVFTTSTTWLTKNYVRCFLSVQRISFNNDSDSLNFPETCYINYFMAQESCPMALREELNLETKA